VAEQARWPSLTAELLGPLGDTLGDRGAMLDTAQGIPRRLADLAVRHQVGRARRVTDHDIRTALAAPSQPAPAPATPFAWSSRTARRALGLAAVRSVIDGTARSVIDGVHRAGVSAVRSANEGRGSAASMDRWLSGLPGAALAAVEAEAVTWATRLWCALDWAAFEETPIIGRDRWWDSPHSSLLALRSRAEVRSVGRGPGGDPFSVHLVMLGGPRRASIRSELSVVALVEAMRAPGTLPPGRIVGWWPDSGHVVKVEVDRPALEEGVATVARTLTCGEAAPVPFEGASRAAA
jgi:hypothetical protein